MIVTFYNTNNDYRELTKTLTDGVQHNHVKIKEDTEIETPTLIIEGDPINANYCYIPTFNRYYFIVSQTVLTGNRTVIKCRVDVLTTYESAIRTSTQLITRQENVGVNEIVDNQLPLTNDSGLTIIKFPNSPFFDGVTASTKCFLLNVIGR